MGVNTWDLTVSHSQCCLNTINVLINDLTYLCYTKFVKIHPIYVIFNLVIFISVIITTLISMLNNNPISMNTITIVTRACIAHYPLPSMLKWETPSQAALRNDSGCCLVCYGDGI